MSPRIAGMLLLLAACFGLACGQGGSGGSSGGGGSPPVGEQPRNLLLISMDTTRADRLGCYGFAGAGTPRLDRLASEGTRGARAFTVAPLTLPAHASLMTGLYPPSHGVRDNVDFRLPGSATTLAEHLAGQGYATAAAVGAYVLSAEFGIAQGFAAYDEPRGASAAGSGGASVVHREILERDAAAVTDAALELLSELQEPFFLWVHYFDPHAAYEPPEPFAGNHPADPYQGEIAYTDSQLGRLFDRLAADGRAGRTLTVVTADHGESLGEHGEDTHGLFVYDATIKVPLLIHAPGTVPVGVLDEAVSLADIAPTALELLGVPALEAIDGVSFAEALTAAPAGEREPVYAESMLPELSYGWAPLRALRSGQHKYIDAPLPELYDTEIDPGERHNLVHARPVEIRSWGDRLLERSARFEPLDPDEELVADPERRRRLAALGYLSGSTPAAGGELGADPKERVHLHNALQEAQQQLIAGRHEVAAGLVEQVLTEDPGNPSALALSGLALAGRGADADSLDRLRRAAAGSPGSFELQRNLGNALLLAGNHEEAARAFEAALAVRPGAGDARYGLGNAQWGAGRRDDALASYRRAIADGEAGAGVHAALGSSLADLGRLAEARRVLEKAVTLEGAGADVRNRLGIVCERLEDPAAAAQHYRQALQLDPDHADALFNRAKLDLVSGRVEAAAAGVERLLARHSGYPLGRYLEAQVRLGQGRPTDAAVALRAFLNQPGISDTVRQRAARQLAELQKGAGGN